MPISSNFQLAVELTNLFPVRELTGQVYQRVLGFARDLKRSGSDIVVEEDLAATFGRGQIDQKIEKQFRSDILRDTEIHTLYPKSEVCLDTTPGPTLKRALTDPDRFYISTIIQLSLLGWVHGRNSLAAVLADCLNKRYDMALPDARPNPGYEGIFGMLEACSSQTSNFNWSRYLQSVENRLGQQTIDNATHGRFVSLRPQLLLAAMDYLYIIQKFPEERKMIVSGSHGILTMIVWAYHVLNLTVLVKGAPRGDIMFGDEQRSPQVIILWGFSPTNLSSTDPEEEHNVCLLDKDSEVVLQTEPNISDILYLEACERLPLQNYGTTLLYRTFNKCISTSTRDPIYADAAQMVAAMAITSSRKLSRAPADQQSSGNEPAFTIDRWRIMTVADIIFKDLHLETPMIDRFVEALVQDRDLGNESILPRSLQLYLAKTGHMSHTHSGLLRQLTTLVILLSTISGIEHGQMLPLKSDLLQVGRSLEALRGPRAIPEYQLLDSISRMLLGNRSYGQVIGKETSIDDRVFLVSDFGWSVFLGVVGDTDPASINPEMLFLRKGTPTKLRTGERRSIMRDTEKDVLTSNRFSLVPELQILDKGRSYKPRSIYSVDQRYEYYGVLKDDFQLNIRFMGSEIYDSKYRSQHLDQATKAAAEERGFDREAGRGLFGLGPSTPDPQEALEEERIEPFTFDTSYRHLHSCLWKVTYTSPCNHPPDSGDNGSTLATAEVARLGVGAATATIFGWEMEALEDFGKAIVVPHRICVLMVKGNRRARWLAVENATMSRTRRVMLRTKDCCENCAFDLVSQLEEKWLLII